MKKKVVLALLLLAVAAVGSVFAKPGDRVNQIMFGEKVGGKTNWCYWNLGTGNINGKPGAYSTLFNGPKYMPYPGIGPIEGSKAQIWIVDAKQSLTGIDVTYTCNNAPGTVEFTFTATFSSGRSGGVTWKNTEKITSPRKNSTWRFPLANYLYIEKLDIVYEIK